MWRQAVHERLTAHKYRSTRTRDAVIDYLADQHYLIPVEQISDAVQVDPVTVYRVLDVLEKLGVVTKIQSDPSYITLPESLRDQDQYVILIDQHAQKVHLRPYTHERDEISPTKVVVEIWGRVHEQKSSAPDESLSVESAPYRQQESVIDPGHVERLHDF